MTEAKTEKHPELKKLDALISKTWAELLSRPIAMEFLTNNASADRRAYAIYLTQAYHYTYHTARNQGLVGVNARNRDVHYMRYCFEHALEETGHELMALHDLKAIGIRFVDPQQDLPRPLPSTELLVAYLYYVATQGNPVQRLGYSYWAETAYPFGGPFLEGMRTRMKLDKAQMTFFYVHAKLDEKHANDVAEALVSACKTDEDWIAVRRVTETTIRVTFQMIEDCMREYERVAAGTPTDYASYTAMLAEAPALRAE